VAAPPHLSTAGSTEAAARRLGVAVFCNFLGIGILLTVVPRFLREELGADRFEVGLATTIFFASALVARPFVGRQLDRRGRRPFLVWPLLGLAAVAVGLGFAPSVLAVAALRVVQGAIGSAFYTACATAATDLAPPERRASAIARLSLAIYLGFTLGPLVGDALIEAGFGWAKGSAALLHLVAFAITTRMPETQPTHPAHADGGDKDDDAPASLLRVVLRPGVALATSSFGFATIAAFSPEYADRIGIDRPGTLFATYAISVLAIRSVVGRLADRLGPRRMAIPGLALGAGGLAGLALSPGPQWSYVAMAAVGFGSGGTFPSLSAIAVGSVGDRFRGRALATFLTFNDVGQGVAGPLVGFLAADLSFRWVFGVPAIVGALGFIALAALAEWAASAARPSG
jgi:MFS family permease